MTYREKWGSLHLGMRIDRAVSRGIAHFQAAHGKSVSPMDFSPYDKANQPPPSIEDVFGMLKSAAKQNQE